MIDSESRVPAGSGGGQFRLDLDDNETSDTYTMPKLNELDLHEILDEPVKLPVTKLVIFYTESHIMVLQLTVGIERITNSAAAAAAAAFSLCLSCFLYQSYSSWADF